MIKLWIAQKMRFLACFGWFISGVLFAVAPLILAVPVFILAFVADYYSFKCCADFVE